MLSGEILYFYAAYLRSFWGVLDIMIISGFEERGNVDVCPLQGIHGGSWTKWSWYKRRLYNNDDDYDSDDEEMMVEWWMTTDCTGGSKKFGNLKWRRKHLMIAMTPWWWGWVKLWRGWGWWWWIDNNQPGVEKMFVAKRQMSKRQKLPFCSCRICRMATRGIFFPSLLDKLNRNGEWVLYIGQHTRKLSRHLFKNA